MTKKLTWNNPNAIISCGWLHDNLKNPNIRIYDCTTYLPVSYTHLTLPTTPYV